MSPSPWRGLGAATALALLVVPACRGGASREAFCRRVVDVPVVNDADTLVEPGGEELLDELVSALEELRAASPGEVRPDLNTLVDVTRDLREVLQEGGADASAQEVMAELRAGLAYYGAASGRVVAYTERACGIDLTTATPVPTVTTTTLG